MGSNAKDPASLLLVYIAALAAGVVLVFVKIAYSFFPLFNVLDAIVFGGIGVFFGGWRRGMWWLKGFLLAAPCLVVSWRSLMDLSPTEVEAGAALGWTVSAVLVPAAAIIGAWLGTRWVYARRRTHAERERGAGVGDRTPTS
jgi:hypothetical protein